MRSDEVIILCIVLLALMVALIGTIAIAWKATEMAEDSYIKITRKKGALILVFLDTVLFGILIYLVIAK